MQTEHRRVTIGIPQSHSSAVAAPVRKPMVAKGHDAILKSLQDQRAYLRIYSVSGEIYEGQVIARDRWTITLRLSDGSNHTVYKHAIESFSPTAVTA